MPRLKWVQRDTRRCCYSIDSKIFFGSYWKNGKCWNAHIYPIGMYWFVRNFPEGTDEKEVKKECQKFINHFSKEKDKWFGGLGDCR